jgi:DNA-binding transcriptional ArsR family regulator
MVERLSRGPASVSELAEPLEMSLPAVVQHLHVLEGSGLVASEKVGRVRNCRVKRAPHAGWASAPAWDDEQELRFRLLLLDARKSFGASHRWRRLTT